MVLCTGSIAYDYILTFKGRFKDHILLDKTHILNLSFLVDDLQKRRGGVAGNYAYNLALLGHPAAVLATAGGDAAEYRDWLVAHGIDCRGLRLLDGEISATGFTTTDMDDNQLTGYYGGAMWKAAMLGLDDGPRDLAAVIIGPNDPGAMKRLVSECRNRGVPFVFDPAHQLPMMDGIQERTKRGMEGLLELSQMVVTTLGRQGSRITTRDGSVDVPAAPAEREADPTGAGDAYRAGLVAGLLRGLQLAEAGRVASLAATYAVEQIGTIEHGYTREEFCARHVDAFGCEVSEKLWLQPIA